MSRRNKKLRRTREDIQREQQALLEKTEREIDEIVAEFHEKLPRKKAKAIGALYARFSSRFQDSIADQIRTLYEAAVAEGIFVPRELIFFDLAVRGWKDRRPGLIALRAAIERKAFQVFLVFTTSRLFRRTHKALRFVEEELVERGIRGVFLKSGLDTSDGENWRTTFQLFAAMDEAMVRMCGSHVQAAHEGLFRRGLVFGSLPLGFTGEEVPGELTKRKRPRRRIIVDPETAPWIEKIFDMYVVGAKSLAAIAQELNDDADAPAPNKSLTGLWTPVLVRAHLANVLYRGLLCYGVKETKWLSEKDYAKQVPRDEPLKSEQFENLRIVSDEQWYRAQQLLANERGNSGRKPNDGDRQSRPRLLRGLFVCPQHEQQLVVSGPYGRVLVCKKCKAIKAKKRPLFSHLNRALALQLTCEKLAELVRADEAFVDEIIAACQSEADAAQQPDPEVLKRLRQQAKKLSSTIDFNCRNPGDAKEEQRQTEQLLKELRRQRTDVLAELASHEAARNGPIVVPERAEVIRLLDELADILTAAASAETEEQMRPARRIIDELTGGKIELIQMGERRKGCGWLQGRFKVDVVSMTLNRLTGLQLVADGENSLEVAIDYKAPQLIEQQSEEAKRLWDEGLLNMEIAERMGCQRSYVTKLIKFWYSSRGLSRPDGRHRRAQLSKKQTSTPAYQQLADKVVQLVDSGLSNLSIAKQLNTSDATVAKAIAWWFESHGHSIPSAQDRRRKMLQRAKSMLEEGMLMKDIAAELDYTPRGLKLALDKFLAENGETLPDGRSQRGNANRGQPANGRQRRDADRRKSDK